MCVRILALSGTQIASSMLLTVLSPVACLAVPYISTLGPSPKRRVFRNKYIEYKMRVLSFCTTFFPPKHFSFYRSADKSLARPGTKQAASVKSVMGRGVD